jgi:predicted dehydrogenase
MKFPSGVMSYSAATYKFNGLNRFTAYAEKGSFGLDPAYSYDGLKGSRSDQVPLNFSSIDQFAAEMDDFALCILNNKPTRVPGEEGLRDVKILMAIYEAARTGKTVMLD